MSMGGSMIEAAKRASTNSKLDAIETALMAYRLASNRLPCPTNPALTDIAVNSATYGYETGTAGVCTGTNISTYTIPAGSGNTSIASNTVVAEGALPVRTLGLPDEYMFDGWGRKFAYAIWTPITAAGAFISYGINPSCGAITVKNAGHGYRTQAAAYALISYGPDGHGGYNKGGARYNAGVSNADEDTNAHYNSSGSDTGYLATYVQKDISLDGSDATHPFSHILRFKERWQMQNAYDGYTPAGIPCTPGFRIDGTTAGEGLGNMVWTADMNGDGIPDLIILDVSLDTIYVIFGRSDSNFPDPFLVSSLDGTNGFKINNFGTFYRLAIGNINGATNNGHPIQDIIITRYGTNCSFNHNPYVIFGQTAGWPAVVNASSLTNATNPKGMTLTNNPRDCSNVAIADINNDGYDDIIFAQSVNGNHLPTAVVFGGAAMPSSVNISTLAGGVATAGGGFTITDTGHRTDGLGYSGGNGIGGPNKYLLSGVAAGDLNHDGIKDILLDSSGGYAYAIWGHNAAYSWPASIDIGSLAADGSVGVEFNCGGGSCGGALYSITAGDINGDGIDDMTFSQASYICHAGGGNTGRFDTVFGKAAASWTSNSFDVNAVDGTNGTTLEGNWANADITPGLPMMATFPGGKTGFMGTFQGSGTNGPTDNHAFLFNSGTSGHSWTSYLGTQSLNGTTGFRFVPVSKYSPVAIGDINADGTNDFIIGDAGAATAGKTYVIWGASPMAASSYSAASFPNSSIGVELDGATAGDNSGWAVTTWDANNDGKMDVVTCAPYGSNQAANAGSCYVMWGHTGSWKTTINLGTF